MANIKLIRDVDYDRASDTLKHVLDKEDNRFINVCEQKMQRAFGMAAARLVKRQMIYSINEAIKSNPVASRKDIVKAFVGQASVMADLVKGEAGAEKAAASIEATRNTFVKRTAGVVVTLG